MNMPTPKDVELRRELAQLRADNIRLINEKAALLGRLLIPSRFVRDQWLIPAEGDSASYYTFPDRDSAERFLLGGDS